PLAAEHPPPDPALRNLALGRFDLHSPRDYLRPARFLPDLPSAPRRLVCLALPLKRLSDRQLLLPSGQAVVRPFLPPMAAKHRQWHWRRAAAGRQSASRAPAKQAPRRAAHPAGRRRARAAAHSG